MAIRFNPNDNQSTNRFIYILFEQHPLKKGYRLEILTNLIFIYRGQVYEFGLDNITYID